MWSAVAPCDAECPAPSSRSKHSATHVGEHVYVLGGRNGNLPMKDFWKYNLVTGKWQHLKPSGDKLPCLQEHSAVAYKDNIYVFGGEVGFSAGTETPLWVYDIRNNSWRKIRTRKGVSTPKGRRGHTALVHRGTMLLYGGYQDLKGSCGELWGYHFETESWHLVNRTPTKGTSDAFPLPRHKHSAVLHDDAMWIYGGMTDLQERSDLWKWDIASGVWTNIKTKINPGPLQGHAACRLPSCMVIFGGEREGHSTNDLWKFNYSTELWEKIILTGVKPQPRAESIAFTVSELVLKNKISTSVETRATRTRLRTCNSADRGSRHSSYFPTNRVSPYEQTFVFKPSEGNYVDGSDVVNQYSENGNRSSLGNKTSFLQEISKLSQLNISRINNKCSYTVLTGCNTDSTESLLKPTLSPGVEHEMEDIEFSTPTRGTLIKSKSAYVIKKKYSNDVSPVTPDVKEVTQKKRVEFDSTAKKITREPISVPNFSLLTLPTPVLTPVEATRLVYLDMEEENYHYDDEFAIPFHNITQVKPSTTDNDLKLYDTFKPVKRGESYSSHIGYADNPLYQHMLNSSPKSYNYAVPENSDENVSSTSDYCSIETVNRLSSGSNYSVKMNTPQEERTKIRNKENAEGPFGFCNPNYMGPDVKTLLNGDSVQKKQAAKLINTPDSVIDDYNNSTNSDAEDILELQNLDGTIGKNTKVFYRHSSRNKRPPKSLPLENANIRLKSGKCRASSASRVEKNSARHENLTLESEVVISSSNSVIPLYIFLVGGKEQGQVTVFKRPISIWKLKLF